MPGTRWTAAAAIAAVLLLAGCTPEPEPTPSPTGFATEAEAFAAAEETIQSYIDAGNQVDLADPTTFEPVLAWTTGEQHEVERKSFSELHADGITILGDSRLIGVDLREWDASTQTVRATMCNDVSGVDVLDSSGESIVSPDRPDHQPQEVTLVRANGSPSGLLIASVSDGEDDAACAG